MKLKEIADKLDCKLTGRGDVEINRVAGINEAGEGDITFVSNPKYMKYIKTTGASAIILAHDAPEVSIPSLRCDNPYYIFAKTLEFFYNPPSPPGEIHSTAVISPGSTTGNNPSIHAYAVIGRNVTIGDNAVIYPHVVIYDNVTIGNNVTIHSGSVIREKTVIGNNVIIQNGVVIGADGFAFVRREDGSQYKLPQTGRVVIEDDVINKKTLYANRNGQLTSSPLVILINRGSASASEIVAGALRDNKKTKLIGETSFGKGTIQQAEDLGQGAGLHVTIAKWLTPNGTWVNGKGLTPDIGVKLDPNNPTHDTQLEKAVQELLK